MSSNVVLLSPRGAFYNVFWIFRYPGSEREITVFDSEEIFLFLSCHDLKAD